MSLSQVARDALRGAIATRGKHRGQLLSKCPRSETLSAAAWQAAMLCVNPYKASIGAMLFMSPEQRAVHREIMEHLDAMPRAYLIGMDRDREWLDAMGVW